MSNPTLAGFDKTARQFIDEITRYGWTGRVTSKGGFLAKSPEGTTLTVPQKMQGAGYSRNGDQARSIFRRWLHEQGHIEETDATVADLYERARQAEEDGNLVVADVLYAASKRHFDDRPAEIPEDQMPRTVTAESPWLARKSPSKSGGTKYESAAVVQRQWSDGTVDYACSVCKAGWTSTNPRSVAAHYGHAHTVRGEGVPTEEAQRNTQPGVDYVEPETTREYRPTDRLLKALADYLAAFATDVMGVDALAEVFLRWAHERPDLDGMESEPVRALTDAEIVNRIRTLVGQPLAVDLDRTRDALAEAQAARDAAIAERDAVTARLAAVERDLGAAAELIARIGRE